MNQDARRVPTQTHATGLRPLSRSGYRWSQPEQKGGGISPALGQVLRLPQPTPLIMMSLIKMNHFVLCAASLFVRRRRDRSISSLPAHWSRGLGMQGRPARHQPSAEDSSSGRLIPTTETPVAPGPSQDFRNSSAATARPGEQVGRHSERHRRRRVQPSGVLGHREPRPANS